ncbi:Gfo/Idh/MocA family oxidoreductase [Domibacillus sp. A3M-37]|uniref:Gfo/Idh/MocA family protein n=1 Tax=Domibacillus sp. A3M-37 TaxID=2962037 RepID=UPI0020B86D40|nr:Gfo/Idh/MocA family oxidoreductase [Domibacillus sp. A3M-37]MCP3763652.1 Gfo/Idh/MocA family oxidoreductase [Domibacillus sp. A3M-37]
MLEDDNIDAVYIPLLNSLHTEWVKKPAEKGKHILCEKLAALTAEDAKDMISVCRENKVLFMEGFMYQFHPQHNRLKEIVATGEIGEVKSVRLGLSFFLENKNKNIRINSSLGGGSL